MYVHLIVARRRTERISPAVISPMPPNGRMDRWPRPMRRDAASSALLEFRLKIKDSRIFSFLGFDDIGNRERGREREGREKRRRREIRFSTRRLLFRVSTNDRIDIVIFLPLPSSSSSSSSFSSSFFLPPLLHIPFVLNAAR